MSMRDRELASVCSEPRLRDVGNGSSQSAGARRSVADEPWPAFSERRHGRSAKVSSVSMREELVVGALALRK